MKNRKLFAILTLIAFMMTLLPVAAFAADPGNRHSSTMSVDKTKVEADGKKKAEVTIYARDKGYEGVKDVVYFASERVGSDTFNINEGYANVVAVYTNSAGTETSDFTVAQESNDEVDKGDILLEDSDKKVYFIAVKAKDDNRNGKIEINVKSTVAGDAKIAAGFKPISNENNIYQYLVDSDVTAEKANVIGSKTVTFEATDADDIDVTKVEVRSAKQTVKLEQTERNFKDPIKEEDKKDSKGKRYFTAKVTDSDYDVKANGSDYFEVTFQLKNKVGAPVEGEKIEFSVNKSQARLNQYSEETDEIGEATVKVYATKAGKYELKATKGSSWARVQLEFDPSTFDNFVVVKDLDEKIAYNEDKPANFKLQLLDGNGNNYDIDSKEEAEDIVEQEKITFDWVTLPSDSDLEDDDWKNKDNGASVDVDNGLFKVNLPKLDEEGKYSLKVSLESGKSHTFNFEAKEQGDIVKITLEYDEPVLALGALSKEPTVKKLDADGVKLDAEKSSLRWSVSDYKLLADGWDLDGSFELNGESKEANGRLLATDDDDYTGELVVTVIDDTNDLTASTTVTIADSPAGIELQAASDVFTVGEENVIKLIAKDRKGNQVGLGDVDDITLDYYITSQPEGAMVTVEEGQQFAKKLREQGTADVKVYSNKEGKVNITMTITFKDLKSDYNKASNKFEINTKNTNEKRFAKTIEVDFGAKKDTKTIGAKNVTLFINGTGYVVDGAAKVTDVAPFIQDNRTFVPVRIVAEALGCENEDTMWDPATQTVTLEREDLTITMTIGSNILTVSTGETVVSDVAPFIKDGRTVLPFRAIAEAFGADVEAIFAADGSVTGVTFEQ